MSLLRITFYCISTFFFLYSTTIFGQQNQKFADSLKIIYDSGTYDVEEVDILKLIAESETSHEEKLYYSNLLIDKASQDSLFKYMHFGFLAKGNAFQEKGNNNEALKSFLESVKYANKSGHSIGVGQINISIADTYSIIGNSNTASNYYRKGIALIRNENDSVALGSALLNAGDEAFNTKNYNLALTYFNESGIIFEKINYPIGKAYNLGNLGMVYAEQGNDELAESNINAGVAILEELEDYYPISVYLTYMSDIYLRKKDFPSALNYAQKSLELATLYGLKDQISEANLKLSELYEYIGNYKEANKYFKNHIVYRDSVINLETVEQMADQRTNFEVSQKQIELDLVDQRRKNQQNIAIATAISTFLIALLAFGLYRRYQFTRKTNKIIEKERDRSDTLLLNILPEETATELKETGAVKAKKYDAVTVLFSDFKGFTSYSEKLSPEALVETVGFYFSKFDAIIEKHGLEKIKTIGDAYMCAGGLHDTKEDHARRMVQAAFEIAEFVEVTKKDASATEMTFDIRIGINTGPVVAGVVGTKKFAYDIWGDTVNVASRMESMSEPGKINISENTYDLIKDEFACEPRGEITVKNRGKMQMYFVSGLKDSRLANPIESNSLKV